MSVISPNKFLVPRCLGCCCLLYLCSSPRVKQHIPNFCSFYSPFPPLPMTSLFKMTAPDILSSPTLSLKPKHCFFTLFPLDNYLSESFYLWRDGWGKPRTYLLNHKEDDKWFAFQRKCFSVNNGRLSKFCDKKLVIL